MATVRAYSVCQSDGTNNAPTVYSYSPSVSLQDGSALTPDGATPEDAYRTGLSPAYCHGGAATADADAIGYANTGGLTPTLINGEAALAANTAVDDLTLTAAGTGNALLPNCTRVVCSTTNLTAGDLGAGLLISVSTNASGVPALDGTPANSIVTQGRGYTTGDIVGLDGFPSSQITVTVTA
jgi:hypothetical protein